MKKVSFFVVAVMAMISFVVFGLSFRGVNAADEANTLSTSLTSENLTEVAEGTTSAVLASSNSNAKVRSIEAGKSIDNTIYAPSKNTEVTNKNGLYTYGSISFEYAVSLGSYNPNTQNTNYLEFTLTAAMNLEIYATVSNVKKASYFAVDQVEYSVSGTYEVVNSLRSQENMTLAKTLYKFVFALSAGTYHIGVPGVSSYIYGIYSGEAENSATETIEDTNIANFTAKAETVSCDAMDIVTDDASDVKLVYFIYTLNNVTDASTVTLTCNRTLTYADGTSSSKDVAKSLCKQIVYQGTVIEGYEAKDNTYYAYYSIKINPLEKNDGLKIDVVFDAEIEGLNLDLAQTNSYTFYLA